MTSLLWESVLFGCILNYTVYYTLPTKVEEYGEENINQCVEAFSDNIYHNFTDLNPMNIRAFVTYIKELESQNEEADAVSQP